MAAARASFGVSPAFTRRTNSSCRLAPEVVPGFGESVPARIGTFTAFSGFMPLLAPSQDRLRVADGNVSFRRVILAGVRKGFSLGSLISSRRAALGPRCCVGL